MKLLLALAALTTAQGAAPIPSGDRIFSTLGIIGNAGDENGGWFQFSYSHQRFRLPADPEVAQPLIDVLVEASRRSTTLRVRYDAWAGRADPAGGFVEYPLCALSVPTGASIGDEAANCPLPRRRRPTAWRARCRAGSR